MKPSKSKYNNLLKEIRQLVELARHNISHRINTELLFTYWNIGRLIAEKEETDRYNEQALRQMLLDISKDYPGIWEKDFPVPISFICVVSFSHSKAFRQCLNRETAKAFRRCLNEPLKGKARQCLANSKLSRHCQDKRKINIV